VFGTFPQSIAHQERGWPEVKDDFMATATSDKFASLARDPGRCPDRLLRDIYDRVLAHCARYEFDGRWSFVDADDDAYYSPTRPEILLADLIEQYWDPALVDAGVASSAGGSLSLRPELLVPDDLLFTLRTIAGQPYCLLTGGGCLGVDAPPVVACLSDSFTRDASDENNGQLLVAFSLLDVALLRALGFPAVTATQLDALTPSTAERLFSAFGLACGAVEPSTPTAATQADPIQARIEADCTAQQEMNELVFVGWSLANLSLQPPPDLTTVAEHFGRLREYLDIDMLNVQVWRPSEQELSRFEFFVGHRDTKWLRQAFRDSLAKSIASLDSVTPKPLVTATPAATVCDAFAELHRLSNGNGSEFNRYRRKQVWERLQEQLDETIVGPLIEDAGRSADPRERNTKLAAAQLSRLFHIATAAVGENLSRGIAQSGDPPMNSSSLAQIKDVLALADRLIKLNEEIDRCQPSSKIKVIEAQSAPLGQLALPRSA
jgi:hypothetical protein